MNRIVDYIMAQEEWISKQRCECGGHWESFVDHTLRDADGYKCNKCGKEKILGYPSWMRRGGYPPDDYLDRFKEK